MEYYSAPMEGVTDYIFRRTHNRWFGSADKYFTPFLVPGQGRRLSERMKGEVSPEHNKDIYLVPQILTDSGKDFLHLAGQLKSLGYREINLNAGCPSRTVMAKGKGAGLLFSPDQLHRLLEEIFSSRLAVSGEIKISVKTRTGAKEQTEFPSLLGIYNEYPLEELIIHPRVGAQMYQGQVDMESFEMAYLESRNPVCYNGDLLEAEDFTRFSERFPKVRSVMAGRGLLKNPGLFREARGMRQAEMRTFQAFYQELYLSYKAVLKEQAVLGRMKEFWGFFMPYYLKRMGKAQEESLRKMFRIKTLLEYELLAEMLLEKG